MNIRDRMGAMQTAFSATGVLLLIGVLAFGAGHGPTHTGGGVALADGVKCTGCLKRDAEMDETESFAAGDGNCSLSVRSKYTGFRQYCKGTDDTYCSERKCKFGWRIQARAVGNCTGEDFFLDEEEPAATPTSIALTNTFQTFIELDAKRRDCGYETHRKGKFTGGGVEIPYDLKPGCKECTTLGN